MSDRRESKVRTILEAVLKIPLKNWPAERPLEEAGFYDSLAQLEVITRLEKAFGLANGVIAAADVRSVALVLARLNRLDLEVTS
jgi:acyl carrier protein